MNEKHVNAAMCGGASCVWAAHNEAAEGARITQASKRAVESRFYPMDDEEPLKDSEQECDLLILPFWKQLPSAPMMAYQEAP